MSDAPKGALSLSGERLRATYRLAFPEAEARVLARTIAVEQTIEFPLDLVGEGDIRDHVVGRVEEASPLPDGATLAVVSYAVETTGFELTQLLNVLFGNISLLPGIRLERFDWPASLEKAFPGPRFGTDGLRRILAAPRRPLLATALKPMGLSVDEFAHLAYELARGGMDVLKDDHGLADQSFAPFRERVSRVAEAVAKANAETGGHCLYAPNVTGDPGTATERAHHAREAGAGALLVAPGLAGFPVLQNLSQDPGLGLPILAHPAFAGAFVLRPDEGISPHAYYGLLHRVAGADSVVFPHPGGRFAFRVEDVRGLQEGAGVPFGRLRSILPSPAGGMTLARVPELRAFYGPDVLLLIGGDLHRNGRPGDNARRFRELVEA
jgi:ribulose-bisphosphate carboxylase large chain